MEISPTNDNKRPKYGNITLQTGIREYTGDFSNQPRYSMAGLTQEYLPNTDEILNSLTVDQLRELYDAKRCTNIVALESEIKQNEYDLRHAKRAYDNMIEYYNKKIEHLKELLGDPRCKDPYLILRDIEDQVDFRHKTTNDYAYVRRRIEHHLNRLYRRLMLYNSACQWSKSTLKRTARKKFNADITKPKPHHDAMKGDKNGTCTTPKDVESV